MQKNLREAITGNIRKLPAGRMLDIPSGNCWLQKELKGPGWEYHSADLFSRGCSERFRRADLNEKLPFPDSYFDYVASFEGLEHAENYHFIMREFFRILKPGGKALISTPNPLNIKSRLRYVLLGTFHGFPHLRVALPEGNHVHMTPINLSFLISFSERYGLSLMDVHSIGIKPAMFRFFFHCLILKTCFLVKFSIKDRDTKEFIRPLYSFNVLLNDNIFVTFVKSGGNTA